MIGIFNIDLVSIGFISPSGSGINGLMTYLFERKLPEQKIDESTITDCAKGLNTRVTTKTSIIYLETVKQCANDLNSTDLKLDDTKGLYFGSDTQNGLDCVVSDIDIRDRGPNQVSPLKGPSYCMNYTASQIAMFMGITGPNFTVSNGACSAAQALTIASIHLTNDLIKGAFVTSTESANAFTRKMLSRQNCPLPISEELAITLNIKIGENSRPSDSRSLARILAIASCQKLLDESIETTVSDLTKSTMDALYNHTFSHCIVSSGLNFLNKEVLTEKMSAKGLKSLQFIFLEEQVGLLENAGALLAIAYASSINQSSLICTQDENGSCVVIAIKC